MRAVIQRVERAKVDVESKTVGSIGKGIMVLVGFKDGDDKAVFEYMIEKIINMRIFEDENDKMNLSLKDVGGQLLIVPNFTLYGDARKGRRPSYSSGASPENAKSLFDEFCSIAEKTGIFVQTGVFREYMKVELVNDGPITLLLDSDRVF